MLLELSFFRELPYLSERFVDIEQESARVLAESVIYSDIDPFFEFPPQAYAVVGEGVPPFELFRTREIRYPHRPIRHSRYVARYSAGVRPGG